jgi:uncharacterized membrane protein
VAHPSPAPGAGTVAPSREDPLVARLSAVAGGPGGARVRPGRHGWWTAVRVLVLVAMVTLSLGVVEKQHCRAEGWSTPDQFFHACYSDLPVVYESSGLADGRPPYTGDAGFLNQPVLTGVTLWAVAGLVPDGSAVERGRWYFDISTVLVAVLLVALVALTVAGAGRRRPWDAALVAASPLVALSGLVSLDLLGVTLAAAGLLAWGRSRPVLAGVLLGLATTARTYPVVLVLVLGLLAARSGRWAPWWRTVAAAAATLLAVLLPWALTSWDGVTAAYRAWAAGGAGYGSLWLLPQTLLAEPRPRWLTRLGVHPFTISPGVVTTLAVLGVVLALAVGLSLALGAERRPRVAQLAFVVVAVVLLTSKAWPVQASLWLLPLAALARPRWRDHLVWVGAEAVYFVAVWLYIAAGTTADRGLPAAWYGLFLLVRMAGLLWLVGCVVRDVLRPEADLVRASGEDDPLGGPVADTEDALVVRFA